MSHRPGDRGADEHRPGERGVDDRPGERGAATPELVVDTPALLFLLLLVVHVGLWFHASHVASAAAQEGARAARNQGGTEADGAEAAEALLARLGARLVDDPQVTTLVDAETARVTVTGYGPTVVPGLRLKVRAVSEGPVERFRSVAP